MSVLTAADFLKLIDLEPFKKPNNEAGVSVQRGIELEKLRLAVKEGHVNLRFFLKMVKCICWLPFTRAMVKQVFRR